MQTNGLSAASAFVFLSRLPSSSLLRPGSITAPANRQALEPTAKKIQGKTPESLFILLLIPMNKSPGTASKDFAVLLVKSGRKDFFCRILWHRLQPKLEEESSS